MSEVTKIKAYSRIAFIFSLGFLTSTIMFVVEGLSLYKRAPVPAHEITLFGVLLLTTILLSIPAFLFEATSLRLYNRYMKSTGDNSEEYY